MSGNYGLKKAVIGIGLSIAAISGLFNDRAAVADDVTPQRTTITLPVATNDSTAPLTREALTEALVLTYKQINTYLLTRPSDPLYDPAQDAALMGRINRLITLVADGADTNVDPEGGIALPGINGMNGFHASILLSALTNRPDLVQSYIDHGADLRRAARMNWVPMDYAIAAFSKSQDADGFAPPRRITIEYAVRTLQVLARSGLSLADAKAVTENMAAADVSYKSYIRSITALSVMRDAHLLTEDEFNEEISGNPQLLRDVNTATSITDDLIRAHGGKLVKDYPDAVPGGPEPITVKAGESLYSIATRFSAIMGAYSVDEAVRKIAALNDMPPTTRLKKGALLLIPVSREIQIGTTTIARTDSLQDLARSLKPVYYNQTMSIDDIARDIAITNGLSLSRITDRTLLKKGDTLTVAFINDTYSQFAALQPPKHTAAEHRVDLLIVESKTEAEPDAEASSHNKQTFRVAAGTAYAINRAVDFDRFHILDSMLLEYPSQRAGDALRMLMAAGDSPARDRFVISHSMAIKMSGSFSDAVREQRSADNLNYEDVRQLLDKLEKSKPTIFTAAGNFWPDEGRYIQSFVATHSPHSAIIGSAGKYDVAPSLGGTSRVIAPYSSYGADVCAPLPPFLQGQMEGTSFSTPLTAALYRQFAEWYGDRLSFEEIMAAGLMSADRDIFDYTDPGLMGGPDRPRGEDIRTEAARFRTNGAGLPHHERCGAGIINVEYWQQALETMLTLKQPQQDAEGSTITLRAGSPSAVLVTETAGRSEYVYRIAVPHNMTMGRLTFLLPQNKMAHSEVVVRTPAGFEMQMPKAMTDVVSTFAFAYEDVRKGDFIEIRTNQPLAESAGIILRGHAPGNAIALLRERLRIAGILPAPLKDMAGNSVTGPALPMMVLRRDSPTVLNLSPLIIRAPH